MICKWDKVSGNPVWDWDVVGWDVFLQSMRLAETCGVQSRQTLTFNGNVTGLEIELKLIEKDLMPWCFTSYYANPTAINAFLSFAYILHRKYKQYGKWCLLRIRALVNTCQE